MLKCTYVVLLYNNEDNIPKLVESLKNLNGDFRKEFIFVDDGSSDDTLTKLKNAIINLPRTTIITQEHQGFSVCINKALKIAHCDYVHFVSGHEILHPKSTILMLDACAQCDTDVAIGLIAHDKQVEGDITDNYKVLDDPFVAILEGSNKRYREIGGAATLVYKSLLDKIDYSDDTIYSHFMSLSLRCSLHSDFAIVSEPITYAPEITIVSDSQFNSYNNLKAIYNFIKSHEKLAKKNIPALMKALSVNCTNRSLRIKYFFLSVAAKYFKTVTYKQVIDYYKSEYEKLF